jgi:hypothetical protein
VRFPLFPCPGTVIVTPRHSHLCGAFEGEDGFRVPVVGALLKASL